MRKLFSLLVLMLCVGAAWATEQTVSLTEYTVTNNSATVTSTDENVTVILTNPGSADSKSRGFRWQKEMILTIDLEDGYKINAITLTANSEGNSVTSINYTLTDGTNTLSGKWDNDLNSGKQAAYKWTATNNTAYSKWVLANTGTTGDIYFASVTVDYEAYTPSNAAPTILTQPTETSEAYVGYETSLTVVAAGYPNPTYQWYSNTSNSNEGGTEIADATSATYTFTPSATGTYYYYAVATNSEGSATSDVATVTVGLKYKVSYDAGESGATVSVPLATADYLADEVITLPSNHYFYAEGKSLSKWSDGTTEYAPGTKYTVNSDVTFSPVFVDNTKQLGDEATTITWTFARKDGAPTYAVEAKSNDPKTTNVIGTTENGIDLNMDVALLWLDNSNTGKFNNTSNDDKAQVNAKATFTIPAISGMTVKYTATSGTSATTDDITFGGNSASSIDGRVYVYNYDGNESTLDIVDNKGGTYPSGITVIYPMKPTKYATPTIAVGGFNFENKGYEVTITASEGMLEVSTDGQSYTEQTSPYVTYATETTTYYAKSTGSDLKDSEVAEQEVKSVFDSSKSYVAWIYVKGYGVASYAFETDPLVEALQEDYNVVAVNYTDDTTPSEDLANADLIVCSEAMSGNTTMSNGMKNLVGQAPMLSLKFYNYTSGRWSWGTPANPSTTTLGFTPQSTSYKVLSGVSYEEDGTIKLATQSFNTGSQKNVVQTVNFSAAPEDNVIMGTVGGVETAAAMHASNEQRYFGLGLSSDCWQYYTENAMTIVKNAADMLIAGEDLTEVVPSSVTATITEAKYATFYAEFDATIPENVIAYGATLNEEKTAIVLTAIEGNVIPAGTAVILYSETVDDYTFTEAEEAATEVVSSVLTGTAVETSISENDYVLGNGNKGVGFYHLANGVKLGANQAYLTLPAEARITFIGFGDNTVTAIDAVAAPASAGKAYNLNGVQAAPNAKGVVIIDGKKVVIK